MKQNIEKSVANEAQQYISYISALIKFIADQNQYLGVCLWDARTELRKLKEKNLPLTQTVSGILKIFETITSINEQDVTGILIIKEVEAEVLNFKPSTDQSMMPKKDEKQKKVDPAQHALNFLKKELELNKNSHSHAKIYYLIYCLEKISEKNCSIDNKRKLIKDLLCDHALRPLLPISGSDNFYLSLMKYRLFHGLETFNFPELMPGRKPNYTFSFFPTEAIKIPPSTTSQLEEKPQKAHQNITPIT